MIDQKRASRVRVGVNGYGVIGKRVADAVSQQDDMTLSGIADVVSDYRIRLAAQRGYRVFAATDDSINGISGAGISVSGTLQDLLRESDIVVDCTPKKIAAGNRKHYENAHVKAIWHGGEKHELAGFSFVAQVNYRDAIGRDFARIVSCNTTALCRIVHALHSRGWVKRVRSFIMRRGTDPWESHANGMINTVIPETKVPSHQGPDVKTVMPGLDITTLAAAGPFNLSHIHFAMIEVNHPVEQGEIVEAFRQSPRIALIRASDGLVALNSVIELTRDLNRPRGDLWEVALWEDAIAFNGTDICLTYQVHNESIVIPETIDCIRAMMEVETDGAASIAMTDRSLGITKLL